MLGGLPAPSSGHIGTTLCKTASPRLAVPTCDLAGRCSSPSCHTIYRHLPRCLLRPSSRCHSLPGTAAPSQARTGKLSISPGFSHLGIFTFVLGKMWLHNLVSGCGLSCSLLSASMETVPHGGWDRGHWVQNLALMHHIGRTLDQPLSPFENQLMHLQSEDDYRSCLVRGLRGLTDVTPASYPGHVQPPGLK